jgi:hypothetical protein
MNNVFLCYSKFDLGFRVGDYSRELAAELGLPLLSEPRPVILDVERNSLAAFRITRSGEAPRYSMEVA